MENTVIIEINGGIAEVVEKPGHVKVIINDHDDYSEDELITKTYEATEDIFGQWSTADIIQQAEDIDIKLTNDEAREIAKSLTEHFDASLGICWDAIQSAILAFETNRQERKEA